MLLEAVDPDLLHVLLRRDPGGGRRERAVERHEVRPRLVQDEADAVGIDDHDLLHLVLKALGALGAVERELHVLGGERIAVVELQPLAQLELVDALVGTHRPRLRQARRLVIARHRLHERVVHRVQHPERREHADDLGRVEPRRREGDVERPAHLALGLGLGARGSGRAGDQGPGEQRDECERDDALAVHGSSSTRRPA